MGYESKSSIENLGSMFMCLCGFAGLVVLVCLIQFLKNKYELYAFACLSNFSKYSVNKVYTYLSNLIYWNMILRYFLEGYMEFAITSLMNLENVNIKITLYIL
jgi:hypothetical protein